MESSSQSLFKVISNKVNDIRRSSSYISSITGIHLLHNDDNWDLHQKLKNHIEDNYVDPSSADPNLIKYQIDNENLKQDIKYKLLIKEAKNKFLDTKKDKIIQNQIKERKYSLPKDFTYNHIFQYKNEFWTKKIHYALKSKNIKRTQKLSNQIETKQKYQQTNQNLENKFKIRTKSCRCSLCGPHAEFENRNQNLLQDQAYLGAVRKTRKLLKDILNGVHQTTSISSKFQPKFKNMLTNPEDPRKFIKSRSSNLPDMLQLINHLKQEQEENLKREQMRKKEKNVQKSQILSKLDIHKQLLTRNTYEKLKNYLQSSQTQQQSLNTSQNDLKSYSPCKTFNSFYQINRNIKTPQNFEYKNNINSKTNSRSQKILNVFFNSSQKNRIQQESPILINQSSMEFQLLPEKSFQNTQNQTFIMNLNKTIKMNRSQDIKSKLPHINTIDQFQKIKNKKIFDFSRIKNNQKQREKIQKLNSLYQI